MTNLNTDGNLIALNTKGATVATHQVNLDALIKRADFLDSGISGSRSRRLSNELKIEDLHRAYKNLLRKPDFQRETASWRPEAVTDFVKSFLDNDLIPSIILWWSESNGTLFVIDGAHRISSLLAWVYNDYGDGDLSKEFWDFQIPEAQRKLAVATRKLIESEVGEYKLLKFIAENGPNDEHSPDLVRRARNMVTFKIDVQWVEGNAETAEKSFYKINNSASTLGPTELAIIKARRKPNAIAARALINAGSGHKYWDNFEKDVVNEIEQISRSVYDLLFTRLLLAGAVKTTDLPVAGHAYSANAFKMILDLVNMVNGVTDSMWIDVEKKNKKVDPLEDDVNGHATVEYLKNVRKAANLISGTTPGSLGLHPFVYFYSDTARFQPAAFLAGITFVRNLKERNQLAAFTAHRARFEDFLIDHRRIASDLGHAYGSRTRSVDHIVTMYERVLELVMSGVESHSDIRMALRQHPEIGPKLSSLVEDVERARTKKRKAGVDQKNAAFLREARDTPLKCSICSARMHTRSITQDHVERAEDGGTGDSDNLQSTHPYCNSGYKESLHHKRTKGGKSGS